MGRTSFLPTGCIRVVEVVLLLNMSAISIGILTSPLILIERFNHIYNYTNDNVASEPCGVNVSNSTLGSNSTGDEMEAMIERKVSQWTWYFTVSSLLPAIPLTALVFGPWSDRVGRRVIIMLGTVGNLCSYIALFLFHWLQLPFYFLIVAYIIQGLTGGQAGVIGTSFAYISDVSTKEHRTTRLTIVEAVVFLASGIGFALGSELTEHYNLLVSLGVMIAFLTIQLLYVIFVFQEGMLLQLAEKSAYPESTKEKVVKHLSRIKHVYFSQSDHRFNLWVLLLTFAILMVAMLGSSTVDYLYMRLPPFCLGAQTVGYVTMAKCGLFAAYAFILAPVARKVGISDRTLAVFGILCFISSKVLTAVATDLTFLFIVAAVSMPMVVVSAVCRSMMSKMVEATYQGTLFSVVAALEALASALGSVTYSNLFIKFSDYASLPLVRQPAGYTYFVVAALMLPCPFALCFVHYRQQQSKLRGYKTLGGGNSAAIQVDDAGDGSVDDAGDGSVGQ